MSKNSKHSHFQEVKNVKRGYIISKTLSSPETLIITKVFTQDKN